MKMNRRGALALLGGGPALAVPRIALGQETGPVEFAHGVASGDPSADGAVLWTRATAKSEKAGDIPLTWSVSRSPDGAPLKSGRVVARASADHTAKVVVDGLGAGEEYHYRFDGPNGERSPADRFRTLPEGAVEDIVVAVASCQLYPGGLFNAYADMAALDRLDAVIHLGDYIYEYGETGYGAATGRKLNRLSDPPHEIVTLADYRRRHAQVKRDPDLQAAHARAAFICVWDDHEVTNDGWLGGAENHQPETEGAWSARKAVAMQAYFEWMPIRDPEPLRAHEAIFRSFEFGDLATLAMVETRLLARSRQVGPEAGMPAGEVYAKMLEERDETSRELLGAPQRQWLEEVLSASVRAGKPWQLLGNQVVMARVAGPDLKASLGDEKYAGMLARIPEDYRVPVERAQAGYRAGVPFNLEGWDGYPHARQRLYETFRRAGSKPIVLSGDSHAAWANNLRDSSGSLAAVEFGCTAISSPSYGALFPGLGNLISAANSEVAICDQDAKGYTLLTLTAESARADFVAVSTVMEKPFDRDVVATFRVDPGNGGGPLTRA
ncbi:alkaline phosphatase [Novosphingobium marinum]|uniref:Alkaline phosphatase D n=1 Tax=Novosphingobium marinum TaxID=1514948 RepID=A0A7Z0BSM0_9SPHN|nr:alkaline phosphatase D family protein [Novosphingobium marinum]NYH94249.1 alkaline phosphatase D [Novosphingobium marinum]GGC20854.1 alkaline phosphatase [Novosphingobium marinum]